MSLNIPFKASEIVSCNSVQDDGKKEARVEVYSRSGEKYAIKKPYGADREGVLKEATKLAHLIREQAGLN